MKKNILMCLGILFCSTLIFAKEYKITENPEEVIRPSILRLTDDGYRLIWHYNKKAKVTFGKVGGITQKIVPVATTVNELPERRRANQSPVCDILYAPLVSMVIKSEVPPREKNNISVIFTFR